MLNFNFRKADKSTGYRYVATVNGKTFGLSRVSRRGWRAECITPARDSGTTAVDMTRELALSAAVKNVERWERHRNGCFGHVFKTMQEGYRHA